MLLIEQAFKPFVPKIAPSWIFNSLVSLPSARLECTLEVWSPSRLVSSIHRGSACEKGRAAAFRGYTLRTQMVNNGLGRYRTQRVARKKGIIYVEWLMRGRALTIGGMSG